MFGFLMLTFLQEPLPHFASMIGFYSPWNVSGVRRAMKSSHIHFAMSPIFSSPPSMGPGSVISFLGTLFALRCPLQKFHDYTVPLGLVVIKQASEC